MSIEVGCETVKPYVCPLPEASGYQNTNHTVFTSGGFSTLCSSLFNLLDEPRFKKASSPPHGVDYLVLVSISPSGDFPIDGAKYFTEHPVECHHLARGGPLPTVSDCSSYVRVGYAIRQVGFLGSQRGSIGAWLGRRRSLVKFRTSK